MSRSLMKLRYRKTLANVSLATLAMVPAVSMAALGSFLGDKTEYVLGASLMAAPRYAGSDRYRVSPLPEVVVQRGAFFADTSRGIGVQFQTDSGFYVSESAYYDFGRVARDSSWRPGSKTLAGMGDVPGSITSQTLVMQQFGKAWSVNAEADLALKDGNRRNRFRAGVEYVPWKTDSDSLTLDVDSHWGDRRYNQTFFGVSPAQAMRTRFQPYSVGGGLFAYSATATWSHQLTPRWAATFELVGMRYARDAGRSPVVAQRWSASAMTALTYSL